jgi:hemolysin III
VTFESPVVESPVVGEHQLRPALRGAIHRSSVPVAICLTILLAARAQTAGGRAGVIVYGACVVTMLTISGVYHLPSLWTRNRRLLKRLDHAAILVATAGTYTAVVVLGMAGTTQVVMLVLIWVVAGVGVAIRMAWLDGPRIAVGAVYLAVGWFALVNPPALARATSDVELALLAAGGVLYSLGAVTFAIKRPNPWPSVFGYHEVFHTLVVAAAFCHWLSIYLMAG